MKHKQIISFATGIIIVLLAAKLLGQETGTPRTLRVKTDANGYLIITGAAQTTPISSPTVFINTRLQTDSNGYLRVVLSSSSGPLTITGLLTVADNTDSLSARIGPGNVIGPPIGTIVTAAGAAGNVTGTVQYCYTETDGTGESTCSGSTSIAVVNQQVTVTIPIARRGTSTRVLYRTVSGGSVFKLLKSFTGGTDYFQSIYTDNILDSGLGVNAPSADGTGLYNLEINKTVKFFRTHPNVGTGVGDVTFLTSDGGGASGGNYAIDSYGPVVSRVIGAGTGYTSIYTQALDGTFAGANIVIQYLTNVVDAVATTVWKINPKGSMVFTPLTLSDSAAADGATTALSATITMPAVSTVTNNAALWNVTGNGSSSFDQHAFSSSILAGYTGTKNTIGLYGANSTAAGNSFGVYGTATGAAAFSIGAAGSTTAGTKQIGLFGTSSGVDPSTLTFNSGVTGIAGAFSNGTATHDIIVAYDSTTPVFTVKNEGHVASISAGAASTLQWDYTSASGGGNVQLLVSGGNNASFGTTNNIPLFFKSNGTNRWGIDTAGNLGVGTTPNLVYLVTTPTITSGFSTTTPSIVGKASSFAVTIAATPGATGTVAFNGTFTNIPSVNCTNTITANSVQAVPTATTVVINGVWVANDVIRCIVLGY